MEPTLTGALRQCDRRPTPDRQDRPDERHGAEQHERLPHDSRLQAWPLAVDVGDAQTEERLSDRSRRNRVANDEVRLRAERGDRSNLRPLVMTATW